MELDVGEVDFEELFDGLLVLPEIGAAPICDDDPFGRYNDGLRRAAHLVRILHVLTETGAERNAQVVSGIVVSGSLFDERDPDEAILTALFACVP